MARPLVQSESDDRVLLVEGLSDKHMIFHLRQSRGLNIPFKILSKRGAPNLIESIKNEINVSNRKAVGIVLDANNNLLEKWDKVKNKIPEKFNLPDNFPIQGMVVDNNPRVGVWFMPDNQSPGSIEDFVIKMIPDNDPVWPFSREYICGVPREHLKGNLQKAFLHAWLATREKPGFMGAAIGAGDLAIDGDLCDRFCNWLESLFRPS